ncbi:hypothetical protein DMC30DRAFT_349622 [Rhodotorula diobovata]|uniref:Uncharacterized protein n=1 Tax=Rhodotorula diobovata TaxID=5288 RepID=A0A5C5FZH3_9BASI|nr:hypothetical protein DMC30DRAFT_349622 [Rhodotorula diobovata]
MLKRISGTFTGGSAAPDAAFLLAPPPPGSSRSKPSSPRSSPRLSPVPLPSPRSPGARGYPFPTQPTQQHHPQHPQQAPPGGIDRTTLHKSLAALSALLVALDELRDLKSAHAKAEKSVAKALRDLAGGFTGDKSAGGGGARSDVVVEALGAAGAMLDALGETDGKQAKAVQKSYEGLNETVARFFKLTAKEEKAYEDTIASLDAKVAKATSSYQSLSSTSSSSQRNMHAHLDSLTSHHSSYMSALSTLSSHITATKQSYAQAIAARREGIAREVGRVVCALAEGAWLGRVEGVKKGGGNTLGRVVGAGKWCEAGMETAAGLFEPAVDAHVGTATATNDEAAALGRAARGDESGGRSGTLRGPRAPSTSTTQTATTTATTTTTDSTHSSHPSTSSGPSYASRCSTRSTAAAAAAEGVLRRPTPRYGSAPPRVSSRATGEAGVDEFGRRTGEGEDGATQRAGTAPQRQDSFVARMSAKYASGGAQRERENHAPAPAAPAPQATQPAQPTHARSSSRVSLLAKRYSSPPEAGFAPPSGAPPPPPQQQPQHTGAPPAAPPAASGRPAPPPRGWTDAPRASAPYAYPSSSSPSPPPPRPAASARAFSHAPPDPPRRRAYESAQPLPPAPPPASAQPQPQPHSPAPAPLAATYAHASLPSRSPAPAPAPVSAAFSTNHDEEAASPRDWTREAVEERWRAGTWSGREWREGSVLCEGGEHEEHAGEGEAWRR